MIYFSITSSFGFVAKALNYFLSFFQIEYIKLLIETIGENLKNY